MKKVILFIIIVPLIAILSLVGYQFIGKYLVPWGKTIQISDVTKRQTIALSSEYGKKNIHGIRIVIFGYIDGSASINRKYEDTNMYTDKLKKGIVYLPISSDWYNDKCIIEYMPIDVKSGKLFIRYRFLSI